MEEQKEVSMQMEMERMLDSSGHGMMDQAKVYPSPLYTHEELVRDRDAFMDALSRFLSSIGLKLAVPVIGGKVLDLHLLYVEVTRRGGLEKVIKGRKWRDVIAEFKFPPTTTSASFALRKYYLSLLHHFEQVYFFGANGPLVPPSEIKLSDDGLNALFYVGSCNFNVTGSIDGKFEYGYLVSVKIGDEMLRGVLYHAPDQTQVLPNPSEMAGPMGSASANGPLLAQTRGQRKRRRKSRDPGHPKPNRSAYNFFFAETHARLKEMYPQREREYSKMIGESWNKLTTEEKLVYRNYGVRDKERYKREMQEYREKLKLASCTSEATGIANSSNNVPAK
ncbi:high mobility group B protein 9-like protein [Carex littledalei]|uniref:High mobility group B protein 9-like protein n=1 Tax=Carex littledalei TaxID=544730 RepID=A0A833QT74_9POAL|nr:high mobility group B protein 9-like protein [Carex littledalei]